MASTYTTDNDKARAMVMPRPWPTMILDRMGIMGNTQGVNASSRPKRKNEASTRGVLPLAREPAIRSCSGKGVATPAVGVGGFDAAAAGKEKDASFVMGG